MKPALTLAAIVASGGAFQVGTDVPVGRSIAVIALLLCASAFFSGSETAIFGLQHIDRHAILREGRTGKLLDWLRSRPRRLLATILMGNELVNVGLSSISAALIVQLAPERSWLNVVVVLPLLVLLGEVTPKNMAFRFGRGWSLVVAYPLYAFYMLITPVRWLVTRIVNLLVWPFGIRGNAPVDNLREDQFRQLVDQGLEQGSIRQVEQELIHAVFEFGDLTVSRIMTPRPELVMVDLHTPFEEILATVREHAVSRIPIFVEDRDNVIGILMAKDLLRFMGKAAPSVRKLQQILHPPFFVPTVKRADELLREMRERKVHMAMVVDEHGSVAGLATLDDLLGELMGEVADESDMEPEQLVQEEAGCFIVQAQIDVDDFAEQVGLVLPGGDYTTLGGFILTQLGDLPEAGRTVVWEGYKLEVAGVTQRRITEVRVVPPKPEGADGGGS